MAINPLDRRNPGYWYGQAYDGDLPDWVRELKEKEKEQGNEKSK